MIGRNLVLAAWLIATGAHAQTARLVGDLPRRDGRALQALPGLETEYGVVRSSEGIRLRTILTRPSAAGGPLPAIFLAQWVSCGSLDFSAGRPGLLPDLARQSNMVLIRVERSGSGDSEGPACSALDYDTELRHYREAFDQLARHPWVDADRMVIFGSSLGATTAPLIAQGRKVAGLVVQGGGAVTYLERMINFDRLYLERSGKYPPHAIHEEMLKRIPFHVEYLLGRKTPAQIARERPELAGVWQSIRGGAEAPPHYGRPYAWHWQAARHDFLEAWTRIEAPVLVIHGEYDQFEPRHGHELIVATVNKLRPGTAALIAIPGADHELDLYATAEDAYAYRNPRTRRELFLQPMLDWVRKVTAR
ncbi:MAG TPA: alpha/beta hydrolase [Allosphingosinicella sp.]|nr:alpha/beta hydrolase [Allosphingosinicella sp.]